MKRAEGARLNAQALPAQAGGPTRRAMTRIAYLISANVVASRPQARADACEFDRQMEAIGPACEDAGLHLEPRVWTETPVEALRDYAAVVIGPVWDYAGRAQAFLAYCDAAAQAAPLFNPAAVLRWNIDKRYLRDLDAAGAPAIPTLWADAPAQRDVDAAFEAFDCEALVVKPVVGAGGEGQQVIARGEILGARASGAVMIQPFLPAIRGEGEYSFLFFGGVFSHALQKTAAPGEYRIQSIYGGRERPIDPPAADLALARSCMEAAAQITGERSLLYARVDMVRAPGGDLRLMELELIEPYYYPEQGPRCGAAFAGALSAALR